MSFNCTRQRGCLVSVVSTKLRSRTHFTTFPQVFRSCRAIRASPRRRRERAGVAASYGIQLAQHHPRPRSRPTGASQPLAFARSFALFPHHVSHRELQFATIELQWHFSVPLDQRARHPPKPIVGQVRRGLRRSRCLVLVVAVSLFALLGRCMVQEAPDGRTAAAFLFVFRVWVANRLPARVSIAGPISVVGSVALPVFGHRVCASVIWCLALAAVLWLSTTKSEVRVCASVSWCLALAAVLWSSTTKSEVFALLRERAIFFLISPFVTKFDTHGAFHKRNKHANPRTKKNGGVSSLPPMSAPLRSALWNTPWLRTLRVVSWNTSRGGVSQSTPRYVIWKKSSSSSSSSIWAGNSNANPSSRSVSPPNSNSCELELELTRNSSCQWGSTRTRTNSTRNSWFG